MCLIKMKLMCMRMKKKLKGRQEKTRKGEGRVVGEEVGEEKEIRKG